MNVVGWELGVRRQGWTKPKQWKSINRVITNEQEREIIYTVKKNLMCAW